MNRKDKEALKADHKKWFQRNYSMDKKNMMNIKVPGDGNCAIHCIFLALLIENKIETDTFLKLSRAKKIAKIREYIIYLRCHVADISLKEDNQQLKKQMLERLLDVRTEDESANWYTDIEITSIASIYDINLFPTENNTLNSMYIGPYFDREKPLFLYKHVQNNHFELYIRLQKFKKLNENLRRFLQDYNSYDVHITNTEVLQYCLTKMNTNIKIDNKNIFISKDTEKKIIDVLKKFNNTQSPEEFSRESVDSSDDQKKSIPTSLRIATTSSTARRKDVKENVKEKTTRSIARRKDVKKSKKSKFDINETVIYTKDRQNVKATIVAIYDNGNYLISMKGNKFTQTPEKYLTQYMDSSDDQKKSVPTSLRKATTSSTARRKDVKENVKEKTTSSTARRKDVNIIYLDTSDDEISQSQESQTPYEKLNETEKELVNKFIVSEKLKNARHIHTLYNNESLIQEILQYYENKEGKEKKGKKK